MSIFWKCWKMSQLPCYCGNKPTLKLKQLNGIQSWEHVFPFLLILYKFQQLKRLINGTNGSIDNSLPSFSASSEWGLEVWSPPAVLELEQTEPNPQVPLGRDTKRHDYLSTNRNPPWANKLCSFQDTMASFSCAFCTCQHPDFSEHFWSPSADLTKGLRSGQAACESLHLLLCAGQWGLPQERHSHAAV